MKSKYIIYIILSISFITVIILPIFFANQSESPNTIITVIGTVVSSLTNILTLFIALLLFNKFGIETPLLEKNTQTVFKFIEQFKKTTFYINNDSQKYFLNIRLDDPFNTAFERFYGDKLAFSTEYMTDLEELFTISDSPFMPKKISSTIEKIRCSYIPHLNPEELKNFSVVIVPGKKNNNKEAFGKFNDKDMTLMQFLSLLDEIKIEVTNWISKNSSYSPDLNF